MITIVRHPDGRFEQDSDGPTMTYLWNILKAAGLKVQGSSTRFAAEDAQGNIYVIEIKE